MGILQAWFVVGHGGKGKVGWLVLGLPGRLQSNDFLQFFAHASNAMRAPVGLVNSGIVPSPLALRLYVTRVDAILTQYHWLYCVWRNASKYLCELQHTRARLLFALPRGGMMRLSPGNWIGLSVVWAVLS